MNRMEEFFRDPSLEAPRMDYFVVRTTWDAFQVGPEEAESILCALTRRDGPSLIRCQTIHGSVVHVRTDRIVSVRECTRAQRDAQRRFWKAIEDEDDTHDMFGD